MMWRGVQPRRTPQDPIITDCAGKFRALPDHPNLDVAEPCFTVVVLQGNGARLARLLHEQLVDRRSGAPAARGRLRHLGRVRAAIHHLHVVQPVLQMAAPYHEARMIELAHRPGGVPRGREHVVERARLMGCAVRASEFNTLSRSWYSKPIT